MSNVRTVSDTKRAFYGHFERPIASVYRRVIEELMVEMHLLSVSTDFIYDSLYALGIVTTFDRFMDGYRPEGDREEIFKALCQSVESSAEQYRNDAQHLLNAVEGTTLEALKETVANLETASSEGFPGLLKSISERESFKYSRAFGIGLYTLIEKIAPEFVQDKENLMAFLKDGAETVSISFDKLQKDIELYCSNLDKMTQAKAIMADMLEVERKKREERAQAKTEKEATQSSSEEDSSAPVSTPTGDAGESDEPPASPE
ncbi:MAG: photosystem II biogenesis protein Psp29 [Leptolyngbya sp. SIO1E4]|nr:photosystem II biogenesis protein Psp29 [Leptolyngbya sp. SIO1E4]